jgi:hypothetical protein
MAGANKKLDAESGTQGADVIKRRWGILTGVVVDTTLGNCDSVDIRDFEQIAVKPTTSITSLSVYASETAGGTYVLVDSIGTNGAVTVVASKWNTFDPTKIGPYGYIKLVPNTNGTVSICGKT